MLQKHFRSHLFIILIVCSEHQLKLIFIIVMHNFNTNSIIIHNNVNIKFQELNFITDHFICYKMWLNYSYTSAEEVERCLVSASILCKCPMWHGSKFSSSKKSLFPTFTLTWRLCILENYLSTTTAV